MSPIFDAGGQLVTMATPVSYKQGMSLTLSLPSLASLSLLSRIAPSLFLMTSLNNCAI